MNRAWRSITRSLSISVVLLLVGCASTPHLELADAPTTPVDLSGEWVVDPERSEDPVAKVRLAVADQVGARLGGGTGGGRLGGGRGRAKAQIRERLEPKIRERTEALAAQIRDRMPTHERLHITQGATAIDIVADGGTSRHLVYGETVGNDTGSLRSGWVRDQLLVVVRKGEDVRLLQRYTVAPDRSSLTLLTEIETERMSEAITVLRVYTPAAGR